MSRYSGKYHKGASREVKDQKRRDAEDARQQVTGINGYPLRDEATDKESQ